MGLLAIVCPLVRNLRSIMVYITILSTYISVGLGHYEIAGVKHGMGVIMLNVYRTALYDNIYFLKYEVHKCYFPLTLCW